MNSVTFTGNIGGDIYLSQNCECPLLRLLLFSSYPRTITKFRVVLLEGKAKGFYAALRKGSEVGVIGYLVTRRHECNLVPEVEARSLILIRNFSWSDIDAQGTNPDQEDGKTLVVGTIGPNILFEWRQRKTGKFLGVNDRYAYLQFNLSNNTHPDGLNIVACGFLAEFIYPYLRPKSEIAVDGLLHLDKRDQRVVVVENVALLRNIDYIRAAATQERRMQMWEIYEQEGCE